MVQNRVTNSSFGSVSIRFVRISELFGKGKIVIKQKLYQFDLIRNHSIFGVFNLNLKKK